MNFLALDIGNTSITFGLFRNCNLVFQWRCPTKKDALTSYFKRKIPKLKVEGAIVSSVVPEIDNKIKKALQNRLGRKIKITFVNYKNAGIKIGYPKPKEIGADRLVDSVFVWEKYRREAIVVDLGTATTFDFIDWKGRYMGGPIAPGLYLSNKALYDAASKLPKVQILPVKKMIPSTTKEAIQAGLYQGYVGLIEYLIKELSKSARRKPIVIATGGLSPLVAKGTKIFDKVLPDLALEGLKIIYSRINS